MSGELKELIESYSEFKERHPNPHGWGNMNREFVEDTHIRGPQKNDLFYN